MEIKNIINDYTNDIKALCDALDRDALEAALLAIKDNYLSGHQLFVAGNGGSAGTANHFSCDFSKNAVKDQTRKPHLITLSSNVAYITAIGNDITFDAIFEEQLKNLMNDGDTVILISASGNSPDIIRAAEYAKSRGGKIIGFTGFSGGKLKEISDVCVNVAIDSYEKVEDLHMIFTHIIVCYFKTLGY